MEGVLVERYDRTKVRRCDRCNGQLYSDDPKNDQSDIWCLSCGEWMEPPGFKTLAYVPRMDEPRIQHGIRTIDDLHDFVTEYMFDTDAVVRPVEIAKRVGVTSHEVTLVLERLRLAGFVSIERYGPGFRFVGYKRATS